MTKLKIKVTPEIARFRSVVNGFAATTAGHDNVRALYAPSKRLYKTSRHHSHLDLTFIATIEQSPRILERYLKVTVKSGRKQVEYPFRVTNASGSRKVGALIPSELLIALGLNVRPGREYRTGPTCTAREVGTILAHLVASSNQAIFKFHHASVLTDPRALLASLVLVPVIEDLFEETEEIESACIQECETGTRK